MVLTLALRSRHIQAELGNVWHVYGTRKERTNGAGPQCHMDGWIALLKHHPTSWGRMRIGQNGAEGEREGLDSGGEQRQ